MRLLSYNIHKGFGGLDRRHDLSRTIEVIRSQAPDLVCLQEVTRDARVNRFENQVALLAKALDFDVALYQMNVRYARGGYGNLLLLRWPVTCQHQLSLSWERRIARGAQLVQIATPGGPLHLIHSHLGLAEKERHWQAARLLQHRWMHAAAALPTLVVGDLNDWRNTLARTFVTRGWTHVTAPPFQFRSFPAFAAIGSLDKAFQRGVAVRGAHIVRTKLARRASDHLPLVIDFDLPATHNGAMLPD